MKPAEYIEETSKAVQQLFEGLAFYRQILEKDPRPVHVASVSPDDKDAWQKEIDRWYEQNKEAIEKSLETQREYIGYTFSQATLAGAVLQIASMGISLFSANTDVPKSVSDFVKPDSKAAKFCIGRTIRDLPLGLIILAARNQYNHWDDPEPHTLTVEVFNRIANHSGKYTDPAFDIRNASLNMYSHNIISLVQWTNYDAYYEDLSNLLLS